MDFEEHVAKPLLREAGIAIPEGRLAHTPDEAAMAAEALGKVVVKAQVPAGKRGKAGAILFADTPAEAATHTSALLAMRVEGHAVERVLVEQRIEVLAEHYAAVVNDPELASPLVVFCEQGGMDVETLSASHPEALRRLPVDIRHGLSAAAALSLPGPGLGETARLVSDALLGLYRVYRENDAELVEVNPLALDADGRLVALDCKLTLDDSAAPRRASLAARAAREPLTPREAEARALGLKYLELDGEVGVLANGAGLTMTTMDMVARHGARPANFLEIGGDAYTLAEPALSLLLTQPGVRALVVNFCGAFARTDVMVSGVVAAWKKLAPTIPVFFSVHGTGEDEAVAVLRRELGVTPCASMEEATKAAVAAARSAP